MWYQQLIFFVIQGHRGAMGNLGPEGQQGQKGEPGPIGPSGEKGDKGQDVSCSLLIFFHYLLHTITVFICMKYVALVGLC